MRAIPSIAVDADTCFPLLPGNSRNGSPDVTPAMPHGRLRYDIHARFGAGRRASASADSRGPVVDSVLIAGHAGTAAAMRGSARESALRRDQRCCAVPGGKRGAELAAGADAELGEDLPQVVGDGGAADADPCWPPLPGNSRYDIHARFGAGRRASARVGSRDPVVHSVLIVGHAGTAGRGADRPGNQRCGVTSGAAPCRAGSAEASWLRELTPSLVKTFRRW